MSLVSDLVSKIAALVGWQPSVTGWGDAFLAFLNSLGTTISNLYAEVTNRAPLAHGHDGSTGTVALVVCTSGSRPASPTLGMVISETDTGQLRKCLNATGPIWSQPYVLSPTVLRGDHATRVAISPSAAWETLHTGTAGETHLILPSCCCLGTAGTSYAAQLSDDGGANADVAVNLVGGLGEVELGALVVDGATALACKSVTAANVAFWGKIIKAPAGYRRLSGLSAGQMFFPIPISSAKAVIHTAVGREMVVVYVGRVPGSTLTQEMLAYGVTTQGDPAWVAKCTRDADSLPVRFCAITLNNGETLKVGAQAASKFVAWGFAKSLEV